MFGVSIEKEGTKPRQTARETQLERDLSIGRGRRLEKRAEVDTDEMMDR